MFLLFLRNGNDFVLGVTELDVLREKTLIVIQSIDLQRYQLSSVWLQESIIKTAVLKYENIVFFWQRQKV